MCAAGTSVVAKHVKRKLPPVRTLSTILSLMHLSALLALSQVCACVLMKAKGLLLKKNARLYGKLIACPANDSVFNWSHNARRHIEDWLEEHHTMRDAISALTLMPVWQSPGHAFTDYSAKAQNKAVFSCFYAIKLSTL